jgi:hypothetical protein
VLARGGIFAAVAGISALVVVLAVGNGGSKQQAAPHSVAVDAASALSAQTVLFGDTVVARIDVTIDKRRVDPARVRIGDNFSPWRPASPPVVRRRDSGHVSYLSYTAVLRCTTNACVPDTGTKRLQFRNATVSFPAVKIGGTRTSQLQVPWPALEVHSRLDPVELAGLDPRDVPPWRGDLTALPAAGYDVNPGLLFWLALGGGIVLIAGGSFAAWRLLPRRRAPVEPAAPVSPVLTPLERALLLLEAARTRGITAEQRKALELVAAELASSGEAPLSATARRLAWSEPSPPVEATGTLAASVRRLVDENGHHPVEGNGLPA